MKHPIDSHLGSRIRQRRWSLGLTQEQLGRRVGLRFQQIHRYEAGINQISASRLWKLARALDVQISFFFQGFSSDEAHEEPNAAGPVEVPPLALAQIIPGHDPAS